MRNITLVGAAVAALTATMLLTSPASAQRGCREICVDGNCRMRGYRDYHRDYDADRGPGGHRGGMYMYSGRPSRSGLLQRPPIRNTPSCTWSRRHPTGPLNIQVGDRIGCHPAGATAPLYSSTAHGGGSGDRAQEQLCVSVACRQRSCSCGFPPCSYCRA
jgi:hypothetical protein